jgi:hypothetical protein
VGERGGGERVMVVCLRPGQERECEVWVTEGREGGGEARVGGRGREERGEGTRPGRIGGAGGEDVRERGRKGGGDQRARVPVVVQERGDAGQEPP